MINDEYKLGVLLNQKLRVQFLLTFLGEGGGEEQEASALLSKKEGGGRGL